MLSVLSVRHSVHRGGPHVTITHDALDLTVQAPLDIRHCTPLGPDPGPLLVTSGGHHWKEN